MEITKGLKFIRNTTRRDVETVTDIYTTKNLNGDIIKTTYLAEHDFLGQKVKSEVPASVINRSEILTD